MSMIRALYPLVIYGSEVFGLAATSLQKVRVSARRALGRGVPKPEGFGTARGDVRWDDADYFVVSASHRQVMASVVERRPDFHGIERGLDGPTLKAMRTLAAKTDHPSRSVIKAACGGLWMNDRQARVFDKDP
eukprot:4872426-Amphidinium_carterae.1